MAEAWKFYVHAGDEQLVGRNLIEQPQPGFARRLAIDVGCEGHFWASGLNADGMDGVAPDQQCIAITVDDISAMSGGVPRQSNRLDPRQHFARGDEVRSVRIPTMPPTDSEMIAPIIPR